MLNEINHLLLAASELRPGTVAYDSKDISKIGKSRFSNALKYLQTSGRCFVRNLNINRHILIQDPKQHRRKTLDNLHYHEYYIDYNPYWQEYPKRYNSLMFISLRTGFDMDSIYTIANGYGDYSYLVFPENDAKIAVCKNDDFINSFNISIDIYAFNIILRKLHFAITNKDLISNSYDDWVNKIDNMQEIYQEKNKKINEYQIDDETLDLLVDIFYLNSIDGLDNLLENSQLANMLNYRFSPDLNKFILTRCNDYHLYDDIDQECECWTDGTCLLVKPTIYLNYLGGI